MDNSKKLVGPEGCGDEISVGGQTLKADKNGVFTVPAECVADLMAHKFELAKEVKKADKADKA